MSKEEPVLTVQAHIFQIDPETRKSWKPVSTRALPVQFYYNIDTNVYRIISVDGTKAIINHPIRPGMVFSKTSQKFGQWTDKASSTVFGLGFSVETDLLSFKDKFETATRSQPVEPSRAGSGNAVEEVQTVLKSASISSGGGDNVKQEHREPDELRYENERLKQALATSGTNAKKWEHELQTLKATNLKLKSALKESAVNVEDWRRQLTAWKESCGRLEARVKELEAQEQRRDSAASVKSNQELTSLRRELETSRQSNNDLQKTVGKLKEEKAEILEQRNASNAELEELRIYKSRIVAWKSEFGTHIRDLQLLSGRLPPD
eukprot:m.340273 g.340273  ORF g.340273 m.340273 type:complete len:320 (-) comp19219_c0_seq1:112-1071(-)